MQPERPRATISGHWVRKVMEDEVAGLVTGTVGQQARVLEISGWTWREYGFSDYRSVDYPEFDICTDRLPDRFDLVIAEQVFEHIRHPHRAARNVRAMLRHGGWFLVTTPFMIRYHPAPEDLWRWTEPGLRYFLEDAGFVDVRTGSWGNADCVTANLTDWAMFDPQQHSLVNDERYPVSVWAMARRPGKRELLRSRLRRNGS